LATGGNLAAAALTIGALTTVGLAAAGAAGFATAGFGTDLVDFTATLGKTGFGLGFVVGRTAFFSAAGF
jgi:hypothetical protein